MKNNHWPFKEFIQNLGLKSSQHLIVHTSFKKIKFAFPEITPSQIIQDLKEIIGSSGSIIFPVFTYCFKKTFGFYETFNPKNSKSKVGLLSETFRLSEGVIRTSSPTHSFALWGKVTEEIKEDNDPDSPLGKGSVLDWLTKNENSFILMLGTDFSSLTYGHYLEITAKVPWYNYSPWDYLNVLPFGVSTTGEQKLKEIPGCAKSFVNLEKYLLNHNLIVKHSYNGLYSYFISVKSLYSHGVTYFKENFESLLCTKGTCQACDSRRIKFIQS